jgi:hypothetical protein
VLIGPQHGSGFAPKQQTLHSLDESLPLGPLRDIPGIGDKTLEHYGAGPPAQVAAARPSA